MSGLDARREGATDKMMSLRGRGISTCTEHKATTDCCHFKTPLPVRIDTVLTDAERFEARSLVAIRWAFNRTMWGDQTTPDIERRVAVTATPASIMTNGRTTNEPESLLRGRHGRISNTLALGAIAILMGREAIAVLLPQIIADLTITDAQAGIALSILWAVYALVQYPGGRLSDTLTRTTILVPSVLLAATGLGLLAVAETTIGFAIAVSVVGAGAGAYYTSSRGWLSDVFVVQRASAFGVQGAAGSIGSALASGIAVVALAIGTWRDAFIAPAALLCIVAVAIHHVGESGYTVSEARLDIRGTISRLYATPRAGQVLVSYSLFAFVWQGTIAFLPTFLQSTKGFTPPIASAMFAALYVAGMVVGPLGGTVGDRVGHLTTVAGALGLGVLGFAALLVAQTPEGVLGGVLITAIGLRTYPPVMQAFVFEFVPGDNVAGDFGAMKTVYTGIGSLGPLYVGLVASNFTYAHSFLGFAFILVVALGSIVSLRATH